MAKDPAFLFYPGDASEDTQFMNRLERGCYFDLLKAQKKFIRFSLDQIKKVLGKDFDPCWPSIEMVLSKEEDMNNISSDGFLYFIGWVEDSIDKRKKFSESRSNNRRSVKEVNNISKSHDNDMVIENENVIGNKINKEGGMEETMWTSIVSKFHNDFIWVGKFCRDKCVAKIDMENKMKEFITEIELREDFKELKELKNHFTNWFNKNKNGNGKTKQSVAERQESGFDYALERGRKKFGEIGKQNTTT